MIDERGALGSALVSDLMRQLLTALESLARVQAIGLDKTGVLTSKNGKIPTLYEQTNVPHIYAIGDIIDGDALTPPSNTTELTPDVFVAARQHAGAELRSTLDVARAASFAGSPSWEP